MEINHENLEHYVLYCEMPHVANVKEKSNPDFSVTRFSDERSITKRNFSDIYLGMGSGFANVYHENNKPKIKYKLDKLKIKKK